MQRVVTGLLLATVLVASVFFFTTTILVVIWSSIACLAMLELLALLTPEAPLAVRVVSIVGLIATIGLLAFETQLLEATGLSASLARDLLLFSLLALPLGAALASRRDIAQRARIATGLGFAWLYLGLAVASCAHLHREDPWLVFLLLAIVGVGDTAALYFGSWLGRHKFAPSVSPNKSWEGSIAAMLSAVAIGFVAAWWLSAPMLPMVLLCLLASIFGQLGDLLESMLKRAVRVKDSGTLLPGHGGILDRTDAAILAAPVLWIGWRWLA